MKTSYKNITQEEFDAILDEVATKAGVISIMAIDGVRELVSEELNNEVLEKWEKDNPEKAQDWSEEQEQIRKLDREQVVDLLEGACIQCYDNEDDACLKTALLENVKDGTITL